MTERVKMVQTRGCRERNNLRECRKRQNEHVEIEKEQRNSIEQRRGGC